MKPSPRRVAILAAALAAVLCSALVPAAPATSSPSTPPTIPQEITLSVLAPAAAPAKFAVGSLHAYLGADPLRGPPGLRPPSRRPNRSART